MTAVVLFAGCGGATEGVVRAGLSVSLAVDYWQTACLSHCLWHPTMPTVRADCNAVPFRGSCDLVWASPSCKPYSTANRSPKRGRAHPEFFDLASLVRMQCEWGARWLIVENVPGLAWSEEGRVELELMRLEAVRMGARWSLSIVAASSLGVAQYRRRVFVVVGPREVRIPNGGEWVPREEPPPQLFAESGPVRFANRPDSRGRAQRSVVGAFGTSSQPHTGEINATSRSLAERCELQGVPLHVVEPFGASAASALVGNAVPWVMAEHVVRYVLSTDARAIARAA